MLKGHGNNIHDYQVNIRLDFSSNVLSPEINPLMLEFLKGKLGVLSNYPDIHAKGLTQKLSVRHHVGSNNILVVNGATEAIYLLASLFQDKKAIVFYPSFSEYEDACRINNLSVNFVTTKETLHQTVPGTCIWIGNPNNPNGVVMSVEQIEYYSRKFPGSFIIIDEAYAEQCINFQSSIPLVKKQKNIIVIRSLTKTFGVPGIRLGYVVAGEEVINRLNNIRMPWSVNSLALSAGEYILGHYDTLLNQREYYLQTSQLLQSGLSQLNTLHVYPSLCNYFLVRLLTGKVSGLQDFLINKHGYLIRDASNFRGLDHTYFRVASRGEDADRDLLNTISQWIG